MIYVAEIKRDRFGIERSEKTTRTSVNFVFASVICTTFLLN